MKPRLGWKTYITGAEDKEDARPWPDYSCTAYEVAKKLYYDMGYTYVEVGVISPEGDASLWEVYEVCTTKVQRVEEKT